MTKEEKMAYIAGLIDGDGSISLVKKQDKGAKNPLYYPLVQLSKSRPCLPEFLKEEFGGNIYVSKKEGRKRIDYRWSLGKCKKCRPFLIEVSGYLKGKDKQAKFLLEFIDSNPFVRGKHLTDEILINREMAHLKMKNLNSKRDTKSRVLSNINGNALGNNNFWAYLSGLMDTDGSFSIKKEKRGTHSPIILLSLINSTIMNFIKKHCRYGRMFVVKDKHPIQKFYYRFGIYAKADCINILNKIIPYLRHKKESAKILLKFCEGFVPEMGRYKRTEEQSKFREGCYQELIATNKYGVYKPSLMDLKLSAGKAGDNKAEAGDKLGTVNVVSEKALLVE